MIIAVLMVNFAIIYAVFRHIDEWNLIIGVCQQTEEDIFPPFYISYLGGFALTSLTDSPLNGAGKFKPQLF